MLHGNIREGGIRITSYNVCYTKLLRSLVAILDADKEGFLRSESAIMQVAGRTARVITSYSIHYTKLYEPRTSFRVRSAI